MRFFFDNCISVNLVLALKVVEDRHNEIQHLTERFPADTADLIWLPAVAADPELIIVSADPAMTTAKKEKEVWRRVGLTSFFFGGGFSEKNRWGQMLELVRYWPEITLTAQTASRGSGFLLPLNGKSPKPFYAPLSAGPPLKKPRP